MSEFFKDVLLICPTCGGIGHSFVHGPDEVALPHPDRRVTCHTCGGTGTVLEWDVTPDEESALEAAKSKPPIAHSLVRLGGGQQKGKIKKSKYSTFSWGATHTLTADQLAVLLTPTATTAPTGMVGATAQDVIDVIDEEQL